MEHIGTNKVMKITAYIKKAVTSVFSYMVSYGRVEFYQCCGRYKEFDFWFTRRIRQAVSPKQ